MICQLGAKYEVEPEFKRLMSPLLAQEYAKLEAKILSDGASEPIVVWQNNIIDGIDRYEICCRHRISFEVEEKVFPSKYAASAWVCKKQLERLNLPCEMRKYLIGMEYENTRKDLLQKEREYRSEHQDELQDSENQNWRGRFSVTDAAMSIAVENKIVYGTVKKYALYARSLEEIIEKDPVLVPKILSGRYKISHENVVKLADLSEREIQKFSREIENSTHQVVRIKKRKKRPRHSIESEESNICSSITVKDMPAFDPDAEITGLTLTIPSWASSLDRIRTKSDLTIVSDNAREQLIDALLYLSARVTDMLCAVRRE